jgi:hypothetical protein
LGESFHICWCCVSLIFLLKQHGCIFFAGSVFSQIDVLLGYLADERKQIRFHSAWLLQKPCQFPF